MLNPITVTQFNRYISSVINAEELLKNIAVLGEISGASIKDNNLYFTLKDEGAQLPSICFGCGSLKIKNGDKVKVIGSPDFYQKGGKLSFIARKIEPIGKGELHEQFEALKEKLKAEGLFDNKFKKPIPRFAKNVGVVTSVQGAVIKDIISTVRARNNIQDITVIDAKVQGQSAVESIANALLSMDSMGQDIIILARGGGSFEELMPFNNETLARVIFSLDTPIISAVGHETDFTIADFVADMRAITPTAGAEFVAFSEKEIINGAMLNLNRCKNILTHKVQSLSERVKYNLEKGYSLIDQKAHALISKLSALNPASLLEKGYFKITKNNESISGIDKLKEKDNIKIYDANGTAIAEIKEISYAENRK